MIKYRIIGLLVVFCCFVTLLQAELVARYSFNESNGETVLRDSVAHADGTAHDVRFSTSGITGGTVDFGNAGCFNGSSSYVQFGRRSHPPEFDFGSGDFSIVGWFNCVRNTAEQNRLMFCCANKNKPMNPGWIFRIGRADRTYKGQLMFNSSGAQLKSGVRVDDGEWHFVAIVSSGGTLTMYLDGVIAVATAAVSGSATAGSSLAAYFGGTGGADSYEGELDEWRMYNTALSADDLNELLKTGTTLPSKDL